MFSIAGVHLPRTTTNSNPTATVHHQQDPHLPTTMIAYSNKSHTTETVDNHTLKDLTGSPPLALLKHCI